MDRDTIARLVREVRGPLNVLLGPASPPVAELARLGVRRVSLGSALARAAWGRARRVARGLRDGEGNSALGEDAIPYAELQALFGEG